MKFSIVGTLVLVSLAGIVAWGICSVNFYRNDSADTFSQTNRPNVVLVYADDLDIETLEHRFVDSTGQSRAAFPTIMSMAERGLTFTNFHVTTPVCGPSRACLLSGNYAHRNNCRVNDPEVSDACGFSGGYEVFDRDNELGHWMQSAGYQTAYVGKYLHNGFTPKSLKANGWSEIRPQGWNQFFAHLGAKYFGSYWTDFDNFQLLGEGIYRTDLELQHCKTVLNQHFESSHKNDPLFVCWAPIAPHLPGFEQKMVPDRLNDWGNEISIDQFSNFQSEPHIDGSHPAMQLEPLDSDEQKELQQTIIRRARALKVLDENLAELQNEFKRLGQLENTIFVITSDHGFSLGAHRHIGKRLPYQRVTRVPFIVCGPGVAEGTDCKQLLANIDIAPTLVEIAGGSLSVPIDGRSFFPLLSTPDQPLPFERSGILIENWESESTRFEKIPAAYSSIRFPDAVYTEWAGGKREYFDLTKDPDQEVNQYHSLDESQQQNLKAKMQGIRNVARAPFFPNSISIESDQPARYGSLKFSGYAEADQGVDKIEFVVKDRKTKEYFNGEYWQEQPASMNANLLIPGGLITRWNFHFQPIVQTLAPPKRNLSFSLVITDTAGQTNWQHDIHKTELDQDEPETWIDFPPKPDIFVTPKVIKGRAIDNHRVTKVMLCILDMENQKFWDGKKWINDNFRHELELKSTPEADVLFGEKIKSFKYRYTGDNPGHILFMVRAYDEKGFDQTVAVCHSWTKDHLKPKTNEQTSKQGKAITQK